MKLKFHTKLSYGIGGLADNAMYAMSLTYLLFFLTSVAGIQPAAAGAIVAMGSIWEVICGPITGFLSDNMESRYGKRKPFLLMASIPVAVASSLLFTAIDASYVVKLGYYLLMTLFFWQSFATFFVPYMAWGSELTEDYHERTVLRSYAYVFNQIGMALGMVMPTAMVDLLMNMGRTKEMSWTMAGMLVGVTSGAALLICALTIRISDNPDFQKDPNRKSRFRLSQFIIMFREYKEIIKLRPIRYIIGASFLYLVANTFFSSDRMYYFTYNLELPAAQTSMILMVIPVAGVCMAPLISTICGKTDKKNVLMCGIGLAGVLLIGARFIGVNTFLESCILCFCYAIGNTCYWQLMPSLIYDVCEAEELASGEAHSGQVISLQALSESLSNACGLQLLGIILQLAKFNESAGSQPDSALFWISNSFSLIPGIAMIGVAFIVYRHPLNKMAFGHMMSALERQRAGEAVDLREFEYIYGKRYVEKVMEAREED